MQHFDHMTQKHVSVCLIIFQDFTFKVVFCFCVKYLSPAQNGSWFLVIFWSLYKEMSQIKCWKPAVNTWHTAHFSSLQLNFANWLWVCFLYFVFCAAGALCWWFWTLRPQHTTWSSCRYFLMTFYIRYCCYTLSTSTPSTSRKTQMCVFLSSYKTSKHKIKSCIF